MTEMNAPRTPRHEQWTTLLCQRLDALVVSLVQQPGALALLGVGSSGLHVERMDEYSDLDFFVIVEAGAKQRFLQDIGWLRSAAPLVYDFENSQHGRKVLFHDGVFAEYAVFSEAEADVLTEASMRVIWSRDVERDWSGIRSRFVPRPVGAPQVHHHLNEALTNLFIGLLREQRGERLSALRFIQVYAVDRVLTLHGLRLRNEDRAQQDPHAMERRAEQWAASVPVAVFCPGYAHNRAAARAILEWLVEHEAPHQGMVEAIRSLLAGKHPGGFSEIVHEA